MAYRSDILRLTVSEFEDLPRSLRNQLKMYYQDGVSLRTLAARYDLPFEFLRDCLGYLSLARRRDKGPELELFQPMGDRVLVASDIPVGVSETTPGGLLVPQQHSKPEPQEGTVIAVGAGVLSQDGQLEPMPVSVGDRVLFAFSICGFDYRIAGKDCVLLPVEDISAVLERTT